jgi:hypothetical protein
MFDKSLNQGDVAANSKHEQVSVSQEAVRWLPDKIQQGIRDIELTAEEIFEWESLKRPIRMVGTDEHLIVEMRIVIPKHILRKVIMVITGLSGLGGVWLILQKLFG